MCVCVKGLTDYALMAQIFTFTSFSALHKMVQIATTYCYSVDVILACIINSINEK